MRSRRLQILTFAILLAGALGAGAAQAGPLAVIANFTDPGLAGGPPWPPGTVTIIDTAADKPVGSPLTVGVNPQAVAITPDGKTAVIACSQSSDLYFIDLSANPPAILGKLSVGDGTGNTFYPASLAITPDGQFVAAMSTVGPQDPLTGQPTLQTQTNLIKLVSIKDRSIAQVLDVSQLVDPGTLTLAAETAAISSQGVMVVSSPSTSPQAGAPVGELYTLQYADGQIDLPDYATNAGQITAYGGQEPTIAIMPNGGAAVVPTGHMNLATLSIGANGQLTLTSTPPGYASGGNGVQSVAITADGKLAYALNLLSPANITEFQTGPGGALQATGKQFNSSGIPAAIEALIGGGTGGAVYVGNQMLAVTPDGQKIYATMPFSPNASVLDLGNGEVEVFQVGKPDPVNVLTTGKNPIAIAIQPQ
jgi:DNA-binding beta-propeller fold protein YncE